MYIIAKNPDQHPTTLPTDIFNIPLSSNLNSDPSNFIREKIMAFFTPRAKSTLLPSKPIVQRGLIGIRKRATNKERPFSVSVKVDGMHIFIGEYRTERDAAEAYDQASLVIHGDHAVLNFPGKKYDLDQMALFIERRIRQKKIEKAHMTSDTL